MSSPSWRWVALARRAVDRYGRCVPERESGDVRTETEVSAAVASAPRAEPQESFAAARARATAELNKKYGAPPVEVMAAVYQEFYPAVRNPYAA